MSKRWGSDYVVTEHRDLQVNKNTIGQNEYSTYLNRFSTIVIHCLSTRQIQWRSMQPGVTFYWRGEFFLTINIVAASIARNRIYYFYFYRWFYRYYRLKIIHACKKSLLLFINR